MAASKDDDTKTPAKASDDAKTPAKASDDAKTPAKASDTATSDDGKATATATAAAPRAKASAKSGSTQDGAQDDPAAYDGTTDGAERVTPGPGDGDLSPGQLRAADVASAEAYAKDGIWGAPGSEVPGARTPTARMHLP